MLDVGVDVLWIAKCRYTYGQSIRNHAHRFFHYMYIVDGGGHIIIDGTCYTFCKDHIYMIPAYTDHEFSMDAQEGLQAIEIKFDIGNKEFLDLANQLPEKMIIHNSIIKQKLEVMIEEGQEIGKHYLHVINMNFCECLIRLFRLHAQEYDLIADRIMKSTPTEEDDLFYQPVIAFMRENIQENITLDKLAEIACLEKTYFSKKFKKKYGRSPIRFLNDMKLYQAKQLLKYSHMNITQISQKTGFQSLHYFSRFFTQKEGISPYEYRQRHGYDIFLYFDEEEKVNNIILKSNSESNMDINKLSRYKNM